MTKVKRHFLPKNVRYTIEEITKMPNGTTFCCDEFADPNLFIISKDENDNPFIVSLHKPNYIFKRNSKGHFSNARGEVLDNLWRVVDIEIEMFV